MFIQKKAQILIFIVAAATTISLAQRKTDLEDNQSVSSSFLVPSTNSLMFGWFDPSRLLMNQSVSFSYAISGDRGYSLAAYTNSLLYQIGEPLWVRCDISLIDSPFNSMGDAFAKNISGLYLTRAEINYRPSDDILLQLQYRKMPAFLGNGFNDFLPDNLGERSTE